MAPTYSPLEISGKLLPQAQDYAYGDIFMKAYNDQINTEYNKAVTEANQLKVDIAERQFDKQIKKDEADQAYAAAIDELGISEYSKALDLKAKIYDDYGLADDALMTRAQQAKIARDAQKAMRDELIKAGDNIYRMDESTGKLIPVEGVVQKSSGGTSKPYKANLKEYYDPLSKQVLTLDINDPTDVSTVKSKGLVLNNAVNRGASQQDPMDGEIGVQLPPRETVLQQAQRINDQLARRRNQGGGF